MIDRTEFIGQGLLEAQTILQDFLDSSEQQENLSKSIDLYVQAFQAGHKVMACGNGGSMCDSQHFVEELTGRFRKDRRALPALSMGDPGHITCVANDFGYDYIFSRFVEAHGRPGDVLLAISTSGNSENVIKAVEAAKVLNMKTVGLLGKNGGKLKEMVDCAIVVPSNITDRIQEIHIKCIHLFIEGIERHLFPENYSV